MIIMVPIEPIPLRYSVDWLDWFTGYFNQERIDFITIHGKELTKGIEQGRFLDCIGTNYYKSSQLMEIMRHIYAGSISNGDTLFFLDLWFPGIEQIKYTCDALGLKIKITGCLHAGAYDPNDMLYQKGMGSWAIHFEHMLFALADKIFVATEFHKDLIMKSRSLNENKIKVTGFPFIPRKTKLRGKKKQIVFPHRNDKEKNPEDFWHLAHFMKDKLPEWEWVTTYQLDDKEEYYRTLEESKIVISLASQETFGIAILEGIAAGCLPIVPDKLSYKEMYPSIFKFDNLLELPSMLEKMATHFEKYQMILLDVHKDIERKGNRALNHIVVEMLK